MKTEQVIALGFFDGVHRGHAALLNRVVEIAHEKNAIPAALTFDTHPSALLTGTSVPLLNTAADRAALMREVCGIERIDELHYDEKTMRTPWQDFITDYLIGSQEVCHVVCGHDFRFGYKGEGNPQRLREFCAERGIGCDIIGKVELEGITVSSTYIRELVIAGETERAERFLGHPHILSGIVEHGKGLGRTIGIPTANLSLPDGLAAPAYGVYATRVLLPGGGSRMAVTNIGIRPTIDDGDRVTIEPWILDYEGDLYGQEIRIEFYRHLRGEHRFDGLPALQAEIRRNAEETRAYFRERTGGTNNGSEG